MPFRQQGKNHESKNWLDRAFVDLSDCEFHLEDGENPKNYRDEEASFPNGRHSRYWSFQQDRINLEEFIFPGDVSFANSKFHGPCHFYEGKFYGCASFYKVKFHDHTVFSGTKFHECVSFDQVEFNNALFDFVEFASAASFRRSKNLRGISFTKANFIGDSGFESVEFGEDAAFYEAVFHQLAFFRSTTFTAKAIFTDATFLRGCDFLDAAIKTGRFNNARFQAEAKFEAIDVQRGFNLSGATFKTNPPDFNQAHFTEAPTLSNVTVLPPPEYYHLNRLWHLSKRIRQRHFLNLKELERIKWRLPRYNLVEWLRLRLRYSCRNFINHHRDPDEEARYRALKRLAIQAHDHENELEFFAGEIRARRHLADSPNIFKHGPKSFLRYLAGIAYDLTSDFGRSLWRPIAILVLSFCVFTQVYLYLVDGTAVKTCASSERVSAPITAARTIAASYALPIFPFDRADTVKRAYICLYGAAPLTTTPQEQNVRVPIAPVVPGWVTFWGVIQSLLSASLIFLLLLAIRNQFKIK